jgi:YVTN family beta-propeller protein
MMISLRATCAAICLALTAVTASGADSGYRVLQKIATDGAPTAQAMTVDSAARRLYAARDGGVDVYDIESSKRVGSIKTNGVPGAIRIAPDIRRGYVSNRDAGTVTVFDLQTLQLVATVKSGGREPREIEYDPAMRRIYVSNWASGHLTALDAVTGSNRGTIKLGGRLRQAAIDGRGHLFVADESADALHIVELNEMQSLGRISVWPGQAPTALANDTKERRIYVACGNGRMIIVDPDPGQMIGVVPTQGKGEAGLAMQLAPARLVMLYMPNASGTLDVVQNAKLTATLEQSVNIGAGSTAAAFDDKSGRLFLAGAGDLLAIGK